MSEQKLSPWFNAHTDKPVRNGSYNLRRNTHPSDVERAIWDGIGWSRDCCYSGGYLGNFEWQGVLKEEISRTVKTRNVICDFSSLGINR